MVLAIQQLLVYFDKQSLPHSFFPPIDDYLLPLIYRKNRECFGNGLLDHNLVLYGDGGLLEHLPPSLFSFKECPLINESKITSLISRSFTMDNNVFKDSSLSIFMPSCDK